MSRRRTDGRVLLSWKTPRDIISGQRHQRKFRYIKILFSTINIHYRFLNAIYIIHGGPKMALFLYALTVPNNGKYLLIFTITSLSESGENI